MRRGLPQYRTQRFSAGIEPHASIAHEDPESVRCCTLSANWGNNKHVNSYEIYRHNVRPIAPGSDDRAMYLTLVELGLTLVELGLGNGWRIEP
jgi:hypothetical protein